MREFVQRSKYFLLGDHFIDSHNLSLYSVWIIVRRKLILDTIRTKRLSGSYGRGTCPELRTKVHLKIDNADVDLSSSYVKISLQCIQSGETNSSICSKEVSGPIS